MDNFLGVITGNQGFKLQQIVIGENQLPVTKTSDILLWIAISKGAGTLYIPLSKLDLDTQRMIVRSQIEQSYYDRTRTLIQKTPNGTATLPFGAILR